VLRRTSGQNPSHRTHGQCDPRPHHRVGNGLSWTSHQAQLGRRQTLARVSKDLLAERIHPTLCKSLCEKQRRGGVGIGIGIGIGDGSNPLCRRRPNRRRGIGTAEQAPTTRPNLDMIPRTDDPEMEQCGFTSPVRCSVAGPACLLQYNNKLCCSECRPQRVCSCPPGGYCFHPPFCK
jgi:hypothetical protein